MSLEYAALSDESNYNISRYRSIASVSLPVKFIPSIQEDLNTLLDESDVGELKWKKLDSARYRFCAIKFIDYFINEMLGKDARVDILIWDTHDDRHAIQGRDDIKNFERMFFHLHKNLMYRREYESKWYLCPDRRSAIDWQTLKQYLEDKGRLRTYFDHPLLEREFSKIFFQIKTLKEVRSPNYPISQLADLFAGMGPYSYEKSELLEYQMAEKTNQGDFFNSDERKDIKISNADEERFRVISHLYKLSKERKLGISFRSNFHLETPNPSNPINFWLYESQHEEDKAPTTG